MSNLICRKTVLHRCAMSPSTLHRMIESGDFPSSIKIGKRRVAWIEHEVDEWIQQRIELSRSGRAGK